MERKELTEKIEQVRALLVEMSEVEEKLANATEDMGPEAEGAMKMITDGILEMERALAFLDQ